MSPSVAAIGPDNADSIGVHAAVLESRTIYLNASGDIDKVLSNTYKNVTPTVLSGSVTTVMTDKISHQYQQILDRNGGSLQPGKSYTLIDPYQLFADKIIGLDYFNSRFF